MHVLLMVLWAAAEETPWMAILTLIGGACAAVFTAFVVFIRQVLVDNKRFQQQQAKAYTELETFVRTVLLDMVKRTGESMNNTAISLAQVTEAATDLTAEVRADRLERKAEREERRGDSGIHHHRRRERDQ